MATLVALGALTLAPGTAQAATAPAPAIAPAWFEQCTQQAGDFSPCNLTVAVSGPGRVVSNPAGIDCGPGQTCVQPYDRICDAHCQHFHTPGIGQNVTLTPQEGFLARWDGDCFLRIGQREDACTVDVDRHKTVTATFAATADTTAPQPAPTATVTSAVYALTVSWTPSADDRWVAGYDVLLDGVLVQRQPGSVTTTRVADLACDTAYTAQVVAFDAAGNRTAGAAVQTRTKACVAIDRRPPNTFLHTRPPRVTKARRATFTFSSSEARSTFACKLDRRLWFRCKSPKVYRKLKKGRHVFRVRARDAAGNVDRTPVVWRWRIR